MASGHPWHAATLLPVPPSPKEWTVVEHGDVRLSVPPGWTRMNCDGRSEEESVTWCDRDGFTVTVGPGKLQSYGSGSTTRNGLEFVTMLIECANDDEVIVPCEAIELKNLDVRIVAVAPDYTTVQTILQSVGVSARWRAANEPGN